MMIVRILGRLYIGDRNYSRDDLISLNIDYVINLSKTLTKLEDIHCPLVDGSNKTCRYEDIIGIIKTHIGLGERVLVHCDGGYSRSVFIATLYLIRVGLSKNEAETLMRLNHTIGLMDISFKIYLDEHS